MTKNVKLVDNKEDDTFKVLGVKLAFVKLKTAQKKYESEETEYTINFFSNEDFSDDWGDRFPKASIKKIKTEEFADKYGFEAPYPDAKRQYVLKSSVRAQMEDKGSDKMVDVPYDYSMRPKVKQVVDGKIFDITMKGNVGNGSSANLLFKEAGNKYGNFAYLQEVLITELVEYKSKGSNNSWAEYGEEADVDGTTVKDFEEAKEAPEDPEEPSFDDDILM